MKRKLIIALCLNILAAIILFCACTPQHSHSFTQKVTSIEYLASAATCTQRAKYYYSCECGMKGSTTFDYGDLGSHTFDKAWTYDQSNHWHKSTCSHPVKDSEAPHNFVNNICVVCNYDRTVKVSSILLNNSSLTLEIGETYTLVATVLPRNATNTNIIWSTSSSDVIKVNNGNITAVGSGTAIVTASIDNISATCSVTVNDPYKDYTFETIGNTCTLVAYTGTATTVEIPSEYNNKPVTAIGEKAFYDCAQITKIILPDTIKEIGVEAFGYCISLTEIQIPACIRLREMAFVGCTSLSKITLPNGLVSIGAFPFSQCSSLKTVNIMSGTIPNNVFQGNTFVKEIFLGTDVTAVAQNAFLGCTALEKLTMPRVDENQNFNNYYLGLITQSHTLYGTGADKIYPDRVESYSVVIDGVTRVFGIPTNTAKWYYADDGITYDDHFYSYSKRPVEVTEWENAYHIYVGVTFKRPKSWTADFYYTPNSSLKELVVTDQLISTYNDVFKGLKCKIDIKHKYPVQAISLIGENEAFVDELDLSNYSLRVVYTDGFAEDIPFETKYLQSDISDLNTSGTKTLSLTYEGVKSEFILILKLHTFDEAVLDDTTFVYDGNTKSLIVKGIPEGTSIVYDNNGQIELGEYTVTATLSKKYYQTKTLTAKLYIRQAKYSIYYASNMDDVANDNPSEYNFGEETTISAPTSRSGVFVAWYTNKNFTNRFTGITSDTYGDLTLYAYFRTIFNISDGSVTGLTTEGKTFTEILIPAKVNDTAITSVKDRAFMDCTTLTNVIISDDVTSIGGYAFRGCTGLTSITIPDSVTSIGEDAFYQCNRLAEINYTGDVVHWCQDGISAKLMPYGTTEKTLFISGKKIEGELIIPNSVTSIGRYAFNGCSGLKSVAIGKGVASIGRCAFSGCSGLTTVYWNATNCTSIDNYYYDSFSGHADYYPIFGGYITLATVIIGDNVQTIPGYLFKDRIGLKSVTIGNNVTSIGSSAFYGCSELANIFYTGTIADWCAIDNLGGLMYYGKEDKSLYVQEKKIEGELIIPDSVTSIGSYAFRGCSGLTSITIPDSVTSIGNDAFYGCSGLTSITISDSVTSIGRWAFSGCSELANIFYTGTIADWCAIDDLSGLMYYGKEGKSLYIQEKKVEGELIIPDGVTSISGSAFCGCTGLTSITIPASVTSIGDYAFRGCSGLRSISIPTTVTSIEAGVFKDCTDLTSITIPDSVTSIGNYAFYRCSGLTSITIPDNVTSIGDRAFSGCSGLTSITIPDSVTSIGQEAFYGCSGLTTVYWNATNCKQAGYYNPPIFGRCTNLSTVIIGNNVQTIPSCAFSGCSGLTSITIPDNVTSIGSSAFNGCSGLTSISIPTTVTSIEAGVFQDCAGLTGITIPDSVTSIGVGAFYGCSGLTSITIPASVTSIGGGAFSGCSGLTTVNWNATNCTSASDYSPIFKGCTNLATVIIGDNVQTIPSYAFKDFSGLTTVNWNATNCTSAGNYDHPIFKGCTNLATVIIGDNVQAIPGYAFQDCSGLTTVYWNATNCTSAGGYYHYPIFKGCTNLATVIIGDNVQTIPRSAFV